MVMPEFEDVISI